MHLTATLKLKKLKEREALLKSEVDTLNKTLKHETVTLITNLLDHYDLLTPMRERTVFMIKKSLQEFRCVSSQRRKITESLRKRDAHEKIRLGVLIIKAELHRKGKDVILSFLTHAKDALNADTTDTTRAFFRDQGKRLWDELDALKRRGENE